MPFRLLLARSVPTEDSRPPAFHASGLEKSSQRPEVEAQVLVSEPELDLQLLHPLGELHERLSQPLDLLVVERACLHPPERLSFHQLAQQLDQRQHELRQSALDVLGIGAYAAREGVDVAEGARDPVDVAARREQLRVELAHVAAAKLYGAQGPVQRTVSSGWAATYRSTAS